MNATIKPDSHNLDKLPRNAQAIIAWAFENHMVGWTMCYMVEVKLDDPIGHLLRGGDGATFHGGNGSRHYAKHYGDDEWAVVHVDDDGFKALNIIASEQIAALKAAVEPQSNSHNNSK